MARPGAEAVQEGHRAHARPVQPAQWTLLPWAPGGPDRNAGGVAAVSASLGLAPLPRGVREAPRGHSGLQRGHGFSARE